MKRRQFLASTLATACLINRWRNDSLRGRA